MEDARTYVAPEQRPTHYVHGTLTTDNWAGYLSQPSSPVDSVSGGWNQPQFNEGSSPGDPSFWVGTTNNSVIVQAGADSGANRTDGSR